MDQWTRTLPEDTIDYTIYTFPQKNRTGSASKSVAKELLKEVRKAANRLVETHLKGYIWQHDAFSLALRDDGKDEAGKVRWLSRMI